MSEGRSGDRCRLRRTGPVEPRPANWSRPAGRPQRRATDILAELQKAGLGRLQVLVQRSLLQPGQTNDRRLETDRPRHTLIDLIGTEDCRARTSCCGLPSELPQGLRQSAVPGFSMRGPICTTAVLHD